MLNNKLPYTTNNYLRTDNRSNTNNKNAPTILRYLPYPLLESILQNTPAFRTS